MTIRELSRYFYINKQIKQLQNKLDVLEDQLLGGNSSQITGMPKNSNVSNPTEEVAIKIMELKEVIVNKRLKLIEEMIAIEKFIDTISDVEIQVIIRMRFIELKTWHEIAEELKYQRTAPYMKLKRYLKKHNKNT